MPNRSHELMVIPQDTQSIFSETLYGVPSPTIPHDHPYPTRFHGPIYHYPRFFRPYREQSYQVPPEWTGPGMTPKWPEHIPFGDTTVPAGWVGEGAPPIATAPNPIDGQNCPSGWTYRFVRKTSGFGEGPPLLGSATGSMVWDALLGGGIGYLLAKDPKDRMVWAGGGAAVSVLAGTLGILGLLGAAIYVRR